jgi:transposase
MREVVNGLMYVLSTGCQWRAIPTDLTPEGLRGVGFRLNAPSSPLKKARHGDGVMIQFL